jgi:two-component system nitrogen regulation response regulator NtrX
VPALRERLSDIPALVKNFLIQFSKESGLNPKVLSEKAIEALKNYDWPGNIRELRNFVERIFVMVPSDFIDVTDLTLAGFIAKDKGLLEVRRNNELDFDLYKFSKLREARAEFEREFILKKLDENEGNVSKTAEIIGVERSHLHRKIKSYGIEN